MKILIFGGGGMAGHMLQRYFSTKGDQEVWTTERIPSRQPNSVCLDVTDLTSVRLALSWIKPDVVLNAVGLLNERATNQPREAIFVNSLFPHILSQYGINMGFTLVHLSTDCVFSGKKGGYREADCHDGLSVYAKTKSLGEVIDPRHVTIRTSIIGPEIKTDGSGLFHWFMTQRGAVPGYRQVYWNGVTTLELAKAIDWILARHISGLVHLASPQIISKFDLLGMMKQVFAREDVDIYPTDDVWSDKSLINTRDDFTFVVQPYSNMLEDLKGWMEE